MASGNLTLINTTPSAWHLSGQNSYQMDSWQFPETIPAGTMASVVVDFAASIFDSLEDDAGDAAYDIVGTGGRFSIAARNTDGYDISVTIHGFDTKTDGDGDTIDLGFAEGQAVHWILSGAPDAYNSVHAAVDWMHRNLDTLGARKLRHVCMPGSHDAGMSTLGAKTGFATEANTRTQEWSVGDQLAAGSRWFDLRPVVSGGQLFTGHYSDLGDPLGWQGGNGQSISDIIDQINAFTDANAELVILDLSHAYDTDNGYVDFSQAQWNHLFDALERLNHRFTNPSNASALSDLTLNDFIGASASVVILAEYSDGIAIDTSYDYVFTLDQFGGVFNIYADSNDLNTMVGDQLGKLASERQIRGDDPKDGFFLLSWTLTQDVDDIIGGESSSILDLAARAYEPLFQTGFAAFTPASFPNVLYVDLFGSGISPDSDFPFIQEAGPATPEGDALRKAKMFAEGNVPAAIMDARFTPGVDAPAHDMATLAMAVNALAGTNDIVTGPAGRRPKSKTGLRRTSSHLRTVTNA